MGDRHFLIVGGTRGIGRALTERLVAAGSSVVSSLGRTLPVGLESPVLTHHTADITDEAGMAKALDTAVAQNGEVSCVVFLQRHRGEKSDISRDLDVALGGTRTIVGHLLERRAFASASHAPSIVLVSSVADRFVAPEQTLGYHLAKAGVSAMARFYALELGPLGIRANAVSPCVVAKNEAGAYYADNAWLVERLEKFIPLGRMGRPEDIVDAILFLASAQASYITGQNIVVDGGLTLRTHESLIRDVH